MLLPAGVLAELSRDPLALTHLVVQGQTLQQLTASINAALNSPPDVNGNPGRFLDLQLAGGGAGAVYTGILTFVDQGSQFGFPSAEVAAYPIEGLNTLDTAAHLTIDVAAPSDDPERVIGYAVAGGGNGARLYGVMLTIIEPDSGTWVPFIQQRQDNLVNGVLVLNDLALRANSIVQVTNMGQVGTTGTLYEAVITAPGNPGTLTITAIDTAGATVNTDLSLLGITVITTGI